MYIPANETQGTMNVSTGRQPVSSRLSASTQAGRDTRWMKHPEASHHHYMQRNHTYIHSGAFLIQSFKVLALEDRHPARNNHSTVLQPFSGEAAHSTRARLILSPGFLFIKRYPWATFTGSSWGREPEDACPRGHGR